jgi:flagellar operon protein
MVNKIAYVSGREFSHGVQKNQANVKESFAKVLENSKKEVEVKVSVHAQERLKEQNINITPQDFKRINDAANLAEKKGSKESLMLLNDLALVVNISNRTIITAIDKARQKDKVFTNIDSTIIL